MEMVFRTRRPDEITMSVRVDKSLLCVHGLNLGHSNIKRSGSGGTTKGQGVATKGGEGYTRECTVQKAKGRKEKKAGTSHHQMLLMGPVR